MDLGTNIKSCLAFFIFSLQTPAAQAAATKVRGNKYFKGGKFDQAIKCYTEAINLCPEDNKTDLATYYQNRAAAYEQQVTNLTLKFCQCLFLILLSFSHPCHPISSVSFSFLLFFPLLVFSHLISPRLISSHRVLSHFFSCLVLSFFFFSSFLVLSHLISSRLISSHLISSHLIASCLVSSLLFSSLSFSSVLYSSCLILSHLVLSRLFSSFPFSSFSLSPSFLFMQWFKLGPHL